MLQFGGKWIGGSRLLVALPAGNLPDLPELCSLRFSSTTTYTFALFMSPPEKKNKRTMNTLIRHICCLC